MSMRELISQLKPAIGFVRSGDSLGSGFLVKGTSHFVTCYHVVTGNKVTVVIGQNERDAVVVSKDPRYDLAVLNLEPDIVGQNAGLELGSFDEVEEGDELLILGFPAGEQVLTAIHGMVAAKPELNNLRVIKFDATVAPGLSGSPCIHVSSQKVIGVVSSQVPALAVLRDVAQAIEGLVKQAEELERHARNTAQKLQGLSGGVFISGVDTNAALADIFDRIGKMAADFKAIGEGMLLFAKRIPLGMGYAVSIDYYWKLTDAR